MLIEDKNRRILARETPRNIRPKLSLYQGLWRLQRDDRFGGIRFAGLECVTNVWNAQLGMARVVDYRETGSGALQGKVRGCEQGSTPNRFRKTSTLALQQQEENVDGWAINHNSRVADHGQHQPMRCRFSQCRRSCLDFYIRGAGNA